MNPIPHEVELAAARLKIYSELPRPSVCCSDFAERAVCVCGARRGHFSMVPVIERGREVYVMSFVLKHPWLTTETLRLLMDESGELDV